MKALEISLEYKDYHNCFVVLLEGVAKWWGRSFELMFAEAWNFNYKGVGSDGLIGENIYVETRNSVGLMNKYHGIKTDFHFDIPHKRMMKYIEHELGQGKPILVAIDTFWCPWYKGAYQVFHQPHFCLTIGIDEKTKSLLCIDGQFVPKGSYLPLDHVQKGSKHCAILERLDDYQREVDWKKVVKEACENLYNKDDGVKAFDQIRLLGQDIKEHLDLVKETEGYKDNVADATIMSRFFDLCRSRKQFAISLNYLANQCHIPELGYFASRLIKAGERWNSIFGMAVKAYFLENNELLLSRLVNRILEAADDEEKIASDLIQKVGSDRKVFSIETAPYEATANSGFQDYHYVNLTNHLNNQGFSGSLSMEGKAEISNGGRYLFTEGVTDEPIWQAEKMKFFMSDVKEEKNDNVVCLGQEIAVSAQGYRALMVMGCSEFGNHTDTLQVVYTNGEIEKIPLEFSSWLSPSPAFGETVLWSGKAVVRTKNYVDFYPFGVHLFAKHHLLQKEGLIKLLRLPYYPNIHIFAITLAR